MSNATLIDFVDWWSSLKPVNLPDPAATAIEEDKHRHYYQFADALRLHWAACAGSAEALLAADRNRIKRAVKAATKELLGWFDEVGAPALQGMFARLREQPDVLLQALGDGQSAFATGAVDWLTEQREVVAGAVDELENVPPYLSLGMPYGRAEVPLPSATGIWAADHPVRPWPWRNGRLVSAALAALKDFGDDADAVVLLLVDHCEAAWVEALRRVPPSAVAVQRQVATSPWAACNALNLMFDATPKGRLKMQALEWAQQFLEPYQLWYANHKGDMPKRPEPGRVVVIRPISSLNTPFAPADPQLVNNTSKHVRDYCLFVRFLVELILSALKPVLDQRKQVAGKRSKRTTIELRALAFDTLLAEQRLTQRAFAERTGESERRISEEANFKDLRKLLAKRSPLAKEEWLDPKRFQFRNRT